MEEIGEEIKPDRRIVKREFVGKKTPSKIAGVANYAARFTLAAAATGTTGAVGYAVVDHLQGDGENNGITTTQVAHAEEVNEQQPNQEKIQEIEKTQGGQEHFDTVFHDLNPTQKVEIRAYVDMFKGKIAAKPDYIKAHQEIPLKYEKQIEQTAKMYGISKYTLMGLISVENGGGEDIMNPDSGALGVGQFLPDTARQYGLRVNSVFDERKDANKSIAATGAYLEDAMTMFGGDEGLAIWSYHAGAGNVYTALQIYFKDVNVYDIKNYGEAISADNAEARIKTEADAIKYIHENNLDISKLLGNKKVKEFTATLDDYSETYVASVMAAAQLLREHNEGITDLGGGLKVKLADKPVSSPY